MDKNRSADTVKAFFYVDASDVGMERRRGKDAYNANFKDRLPRNIPIFKGVRMFAAASEEKKLVSYQDKGEAHIHTHHNDEEFASTPSSVFPP